MKMGQDYRKQFGLKNTCFILANLYGCHDSFHIRNSHVIPALIRKFVEAKDNSLPTVECWGTGAATRSFLYCEDLADVLTQAIADRFDHPDPINLGTDTDISIKDLTDLIGKIVDYKGQIVFDGSVCDGQPKRLLSTVRAKRLLGWAASTSLEDGLARTIEWYRQNKSSIV